MQNRPAKSSPNNAAWKSKAQRDACVDQIYALDLRSALEFYGLEFSRSGKAMCPFHAETDGSFAVKDNRYWHCFGCNESGGLIKFVAKRFGIPTPEAIIKIATDFRLGNFADTSTAKQLAVADASEVKRRIREKQQQKVEADYLDALTAYMDASDALHSAYGIDPFSSALSDVYWNLHKARYALDEAEAVRSDVFMRR